jgi:hypothetical protein
MGFRILVMLSDWSLDNVPQDGDYGDDCRRAEHGNPGRRHSLGLNRFTY